MIQTLQLASPALDTLVKRVGYAGRLLLERRLWLFLAGDAFFLFVGFLEAIDAMNRNSQWLEKLYPRVVVMPMLVLGLPAMSGVLALERRAGSLDLALAVPSTERYFVRRIAPVCVFMALQGGFVMLLAADGWDLVRALYQSAALALLLGAITLFWASRLRTSGAVLVASLATVALLSRWIFFSPTTRWALGAPPELLGIPLPALDWIFKAGVQTVAALIFFLYARERLRRPEAMLA